MLVYYIAKKSPAFVRRMLKALVLRWLKCARASLEYAPSVCPQCGGSDTGSIARICTAQSDITGEYYCAMSDTENPGREYWLDDVNDWGQNAQIFKATKETWDWFMFAECCYYDLVGAEIDLEQRNA